MSGPHKQGGQILILLAGWYFFFGGSASALLVFDRSVKETKQVIERVIPDGDRKEAILSIIKQWQSSQKKLDKRVGADREDLIDLLRRKDATRAEADVVMTKLDQTFAQVDKNFLDLRFAVKQQVSAKEWVPLVARPVPYGSPPQGAATGQAEIGH